MSDYDLKVIEGLLASITQQNQQTSVILTDLAKAQQKTEVAQQKTDHQIKELGQQIGGLGNKFGTFTEGFSMPSLEKILKTDFDMDEVYRNVTSSLNGGNIELDMLAVKNGSTNRALIVELKSKVTQESVDQLKRHLETANDYFPSLKDKVKVGMLAGVDFPKGMIAYSER